jgi:UDP-N-acetylmuramoylalanine--D-glutamate ligase
MLTNLSSNHLDRYNSIDEYYGDKKLLFRNADAGSIIVTNADDPESLALTDGLPGRRMLFSVRTEAAAFYDRASDVLHVLGWPILPRRELPLLGDHNVANALAATLAVMVADERHRSLEARNWIAESLKGFNALEHRIETVATKDGITWINDSKSTNVASTLVAMRGMQKPTVLLLGGRHKGEPYTELAAELERTGRAVVAYGESGELVEQDLKGAVPLVRVGSSFEDVIAAARRLARPGDVVLLSPACSSYDMFDNYEQRGRVFKEMVRAL